MKLLQWLSISLAALSASAQGIAIAAPANGSSIQAGSNFTVEIDQPDSISSWVNIGVAIGFATCNANTVYSGCYPPSESLGRILLYHGSFNPVFGHSASGAPFQNFTLTIPADASLGPAQISVANFLTVGASYGPNVEPLSIAVNIV